MAKFGRLELINKISQLTKELSTGLRNLKFEDNFDSFLVEISLAAGEEKNNIRNELKILPTQYIIVFQTGNGLITAGDTAWTTNYISFKNHGSNAVTAKIRVLR
jgi:hypothetical protein